MAGARLCHRQPRYRTRPRLFASADACLRTGKSSKGPSAGIRVRPVASVASGRRDWLQIGYIFGQNQAQRWPDGAKKRPRKSIRGLEFKQAEGKGFDPQPVARHLISSLDEDPKNPEKSSISPTSAAQGAALTPETPPADPQLASVIDAWPTLPSSIRDTIVAIIRTTGVRDA